MHCCFSVVPTQWNVKFHRTCFFRVGHMCLLDILSERKVVFGHDWSSFKVYYFPEKLPYHALFPLYRVCHCFVVCTLQMETTPIHLKTPWRRTNHSSSPAPPTATAGTPSDARVARPPSVKTVCASVLLCPCSFDFVCGVGSVVFLCVSPWMWGKLGLNCTVIVSCESPVCFLFWAGFFLPVTAFSEVLIAVWIPLPVCGTEYMYSVDQCLKGSVMHPNCADRRGGKGPANCVVCSGPAAVWSCLLLLLLAGCLTSQQHASVSSGHIWSDKFKSWLVV